MSEQPANIPDELQVSRSKEPVFRKYVMDILDANGSRGIPEEILINAGSEKAGISPVTGKRYIAKMCSIEGDCMRYPNDDGRLCVRRRGQNPRISTT